MRSKTVHPYRHRWRAHKYNASLRKIPFLLSFDEWLQIWEDSGRLPERGCHRGQYVMSRFGDKGPYVVGNVKIVLSDKNNSEAKLGNRYGAGNKARLGKKHTLETRKKISNIWKTQGHPRGMLGKQHSEEYKEVMQKRMGGTNNPNYGKKASAETRAKMSKSQRQRFAKEKMSKHKRVASN